MTGCTPDPTDIPTTDDPIAEIAVAAVTAVGAVAGGVWVAKELTRRNQKDDERECCR